MTKEELKKIEEEIDKVYSGIYGLFNSGVNLDSMDYEYEKEILEPTVKALITDLLTQQEKESHDIVTS